ncbi:MAG: hypothetical protein R3Y32_06995 [Bacillota bacterium]
MEINVSFLGGLKNVYWKEEKKAINTFAEPFFENIYGNLQNMFDSKSECEIYEKSVCLPNNKNADMAFKMLTEQFSNVNVVGIRKLEDSDCSQKYVKLEQDKVLLPTVNGIKVEVSEKEAIEYLKNKYIIVVLAERASKQD